MAVVVAVARVRHDPSHWKIEGAGGVGARTGRRVGIKQVAGRLGGQAKRPSDGPLLQAACCLGGDGQLGRIGKRDARLS